MAFASALTNFEPAIALAKDSVADEQPLPRHVHENLASVSINWLYAELTKEPVDVFEVIEIRWQDTRQGRRTLGR